MIRCNRGVFVPGEGPGPVRVRRYSINQFKKS